MEVPTDFILAGYIKQNADEKYACNINLLTRGISVIDMSNAGASWGGEKTTLTKLLNGITVLEGGKQVNVEVENVLYDFFTVQDAIDFAKFAIETTINTMRFTKCIKTVGGPIDILLITPKETKWIAKKELTA
jgi:hypothetical protein